MSILNRRAKFDYELKETFTAGIVLQSNEVKPLRAGKASIQSSYISEIKGEIFVNNLEIISMKKNFDKKKNKTSTKLLLSKKEIKNCLKNTGSNILSSVGCYQAERVGPQIIKSIKGDFFNVLGFPLFPFLSFLSKVKK